MAFAMQRPGAIKRGDPKASAGPAAATTARRLESDETRAGRRPAGKPDRIIVGVLALLASTALYPFSDTAAKMLTTSTAGHGRSPGCATLCSSS